MRPVSFAAGAAALAATLALASAGTSEEPADGLVFDAMSAPATVSYAGTVESVRLGNQSEAAVYRIEHRAPDLTARVYVSPAEMQGDEIVVRGHDFFAVDARKRKVVETQNAAADDQIARHGNYILMRANYRAVKRATESFDGRDVATVALINNYTHRTTMLVRIDRGTKLVLDKQQFASDGSLISEMRFQDVRYAPVIPDADFVVPKDYALVLGAKVDNASADVAGVVRTAGFAARGPKFLPDGFAPAEGRVVAVEGVRTLHLLYSDGIRTVSLFESAGPAGLDMHRFNPQSTKIGGRDARYGERGTTTLLAWDDGSLHYALIGDLRLEELARIAASMQP